VVTGAMFGSPAIYFAPKAAKSINYTSLSGSYWSNGKENFGFMALFDVAYGKPYHVNNYDSGLGSLNEDRFKTVAPGCHSLHAHEGTMLKNDEIIVYRADQSTIKYLVELR